MLRPVEPRTHAWLFAFVCSVRSCQILTLVDELYLDYRVSAFMHKVRQRFQASPATASSLKIPPFAHGPSGKDLTGLGLVSPTAGAGSAAVGNPDADDVAETVAVVETLSEEELAEIENLFAGEGENFSLLHTTTETGLVPILLDLTLYGYTELANAAFELLGKQFCQRRNFMHSLQRLQLLVDDDSVRTYKDLQVMVSHLRELAENAEIWMQLHADEHLERLRMTERILKDVTALCYRCVSVNATLASA